MQHDIIDGEIWKGVPGSEDKYEVSNMGRIKSFVKGGERIIKGHRQSRGYIQLPIKINGSTHHFYLHRIVATLFVSLPPTWRYEVNHLDGDKANNKASNLSWCLHKDNVLHAIENNLIRIEGFKVNAIKVVNIETGKVYGTIKEAAKDFGCRKNMLSMYLSGKRKNRTPLRYYVAA